MIHKDEITEGAKLLAFDDEEEKWVIAVIEEVIDNTVRLRDEDGLTWTDDIATVMKDGRHYKLK